MVDGQIYPLHVAISGDWNIHYFSADITDFPEHRAEDAAFLRDMPGVLGKSAMAALKQIQEPLHLDYGGIDFGLSEDREILLFKANATMAVLLLEKEWPRDTPKPRSKLEAGMRRGITLDRNKVIASSAIPQGSKGIRLCFCASIWSTELFAG